MGAHSCTTNTNNAKSNKESCTGSNRQMQFSGLRVPGARPEMESSAKIWGDIDLLLIRAAANVLAIVVVTTSIVLKGDVEEVSVGGSLGMTSVNGSNGIVSDSESVSVSGSPCVIMTVCRLFRAS